MHLKISSAKCPIFFRPQVLSLYIALSISPLWVIKWKHLPNYCPFVRGTKWTKIAWTKFWANNRYASDVRRHRAHYDVTVMSLSLSHPWLETESHYTKFVTTCIIGFYFYHIRLFILTFFPSAISYKLNMYMYVSVQFWCHWQSILMQLITTNWTNN